MWQTGKETIMKRTSRTLLMQSAVIGLISGAAIQQGRGDPTNAVQGTAVASEMVSDKGLLWQTAMN
jgi:hypothetical protein